MTRHRITCMPCAHATLLAALGPTLVSACLGRDPVAMLESTTGTDPENTTTNEPASGETTEADTSGSSEAAVSSTSGSTGASSGETTGTPAVCGDGVVEGDEECDDPGDTRCYKCIRDRIVFITSEEVQGDFSGMSLSGLDYWCNHLAAVQGLLTDSQPRFKTWVSTSQESAGERIFHSRGRYVLMNGLVFAESWDALMAGQILNPLNVDEKGQEGKFGVFTDTNPDGTAIRDALRRLAVGLQQELGLLRLERGDRRQLDALRRRRQQPAPLRFCPGPLLLRVAMTRHHKTSMPRSLPLRVAMTPAFATPRSSPSSSPLHPALPR